MSNYRGKEKLSSERKYLIFSTHDERWILESGYDSVTNAMENSKYWIYDKQDNNVKKGQKSVITQDIIDFVTNRGRRKIPVSIFEGDKYEVVTVHRDHNVSIDVKGTIFKIPFPMVTEIEKITDKEVIEKLKLKELPELDIDKIQNAESFDELNTTPEEVFLTLIKTHLIAKKYLDVIIGLYSSTNSINVIKDETKNVEYITTDSDTSSPIDSVYISSGTAPFDTISDLPGKKSKFDIDKYKWKLSSPYNYVGHENSKNAGMVNRIAAEAKEIMNESQLTEEEQLNEEE